MDLATRIFRPQTLLILPKHYELWLVLFLFAGEFKDIPFILQLLGPFDLTAGFLIMAYVGLFFNFKATYLTFNGRNGWYILLFLLFMIYVTINYSFLSYGDIALAKLKNFLLILPHCILFGLILAKDESSRTRFICCLIYLSAFFVLTFLYRLFFTSSYLSQRLLSAGTGIFTENYQRTGLVASIYGGLLLCLTLNTKNLNNKGVYLFLYILSFIVVSISGHRAGFIGFFATSFLALTHRHSRSRHITTKIAYLFLITVIVALISNYTVFLDKISNRFFSLYEMGENDIRIVMLKESIENFSFAPITGVGFGMFSMVFSIAGYKYSHNIFIEILLELGIIGFCLFFPLYIGWIFKKRIPDLNRTLFILVFTGAFIYSLFSCEITQHRLLLIVVTCLYNYSYSKETIIDKSR